MADDTLFANYVEVPTSVSERVWISLRVVTVMGLLAVVVAGLAWPDDTLVAFWGVIVPVLPAVWMLAPGLWRNVCPLATANQLPRVFGFTQGKTSPALIQKYGYLLGATAFVGLVLTRKVVFNTNGAALSLLLLGVVSLAFLGGVRFKGKSGWCSTVCPLLPIQRLYGQAPAARVANAHCDPCVGCAKNCFDFNPGVAYVADQHEPDAGYRNQRRLFAAAFPGIVIAFFTVSSAAEIGAAEMYGRSALWILASVATFSVADSFLRLTPNTLPPIFGALGFALFYWYGLPRVADALGELFGGSWSGLVWPGRFLAIVVAAGFLWRARVVEHRYVEETNVELSARAAMPDSLLDVPGGPASVTFTESGLTVTAEDQPSLLDVALSAELPLEAGCRMGVCGADPIAVVSGADGLTEPLPSEISTLRRLGLGPPNRLACMARVVGSCNVALKPDHLSLPEPEAPTFEPDLSVTQVVIIGNGIAGITAADHARRNHPDCSILVVAREAFHLYNRMGISKLIFNPSGVSTLSLLSEEWYERNRITSWLNTVVDRIDRDHNRLVLATGESVSYDRLVLAMGSASTVPSIEGFGLPGCFTLRSAENAVRIRAYVQEHKARTAFVAGGGLLGLEAAYSLHRLGLDVTVGERSNRILRRQIDPRASEILGAFFEREGIRIRTTIELDAVGGEGRLQHVRTTEGESIPADLVVVAAGISPTTSLAEEAGLAVERGVVVDDAMRTSDPNIFAIGDVAQFDDRIWGLWAVAVAQAEVAAHNAVGGNEHYAGDVPTTVLKGAGIDLTSFGVFEPLDTDDVVVESDSLDPPSYQKLVTRDGVLVGGTFINRPEEAAGAQAEYESHLAIRQRSAAESTTASP